MGIFLSHYHSNYGRFAVGFFKCGKTVSAPTAHACSRCVTVHCCLVLLQRTLQEAIALCSCKAMHDPYGVQHFYLARMEEGRRLSKQGVPHPQAMEDMMTTVLVSFRRGIICRVYHPKP